MPEQEQLPLVVTLPTSRPRTPSPRQAPQAEVSWAVFWSVLGPLVVLWLGAVPLLFDVPASLTITAAGVAALAFGTIGAQVVHRSPRFACYAPGDKRRIVVLLCVAAGLNWAWTVALRIWPERWPLLLLILAGLAVAQYAVASAFHYFVVQLAPAPDREALAAERAKDDTVLDFEAALIQAKLGYLKVIGWEPVGDGDQVDGVDVTAEVDPAHPGARADVKEILGAREALAIALRRELSRRRGAPVVLYSTWVQIEKLPGAGSYLITQVDNDVMGRVRPFVDSEEWTEAAEPLLWGYGLNSRPTRKPLTAHIKVTGMSGSGKSSLVNALRAHGTRCRDVIWWVGGTWKLYDSLAGWIDPYDDGERVPFGLIANGQRDVLAMLVGALRIADHRQKLPMKDRAGLPWVVVEIDETSYVAQDTTTKVFYRHEWRTASELLAMGHKGTLSSGVVFIRASQRDTIDHGGDKGGDIDANVGVNAAFASDDWSAIGRTMGNWQLDRPTHSGEFWLRAGMDGGGPVRLMAPYMQSMDPRQPRLVDVTIADVALARRKFIADRQLDAGSTRAAGEVFTRLGNPRMGPELYDYLNSDGQDDDRDDTPAIAAAESRMGGAAQAGYDEAIAETAALVAQLDAPSAPVPTTSLATILGRKPRPERIGEILLDATKPMSPAEILAELHARGDTAATEQVVYNALRQLVAKGLANRMEQGQYVLAGREVDLTNTPESTGTTPDTPVPTLVGGRGEAVSESG